FAYDAPARRVCIGVVAADALEVAAMNTVVSCLARRPRIGVDLRNLRIRAHPNLRSRHLPTCIDLCHLGGVPTFDAFALAAGEALDDFHAHALHFGHPGRIRLQALHDALADRAVELAARCALCV